MSSKLSRQGGKNAADSSDEEAYPDLDFEGGKGDSPPKETADDYLKPRPGVWAPQPLELPAVAPGDGLGATEYFTSSHQILHFSGYKVGKTYTQEISIISKKETRRMQVMRMQSKVFSIEYILGGGLAPGMTQKIKIHFKPDSYQYFHEVIRIASGPSTLLIPIHAYPVVSKIDFPPAFSFGSCPIAEETTRHLTLSSNIPMDFSYRIEVIKPHSNFRIEPTTGIVPGSSEIHINIHFSPIALGTSSVQLRLFVDQHEFTPMDCFVSGRAVSGLLEARMLKDSRVALQEKLEELGREVEARMPAKLADSWKGAYSAQPEAFVAAATAAASTAGASSSRTLVGEDGKKTKKVGGTLMAPPEHRSHYHAPVATVLKASYRSQGVDGALDNAVNPDTSLLQSRAAEEERVRVRPTGPGAGAAFDAGAQYLSSIRAKVRHKTQAEETARKLDESLGNLPTPPSAGAQTQMLKLREDDAIEVHMFLYMTLLPRVRP
jgi:hypothetical protein